MDPVRTFVRHTLATLAYRGGKAIDKVPEGFSAFRTGPSSRTPGEILAHVCDLLDWLLTQAEGNERWQNSTPRAWEEDAARFHAALARLDAYLEGARPLGSAPERLFQGGIADALTHVGQINLLRRLAGSPVKGENYSRAEISAGRTGREQSAKRIEFD